MKQKLQRLLKAGWTVLKYVMMAGGAVLLVLKAPAYATAVACIPLITRVADISKNDIYMTTFAGAISGMVMATLYLVAPELVAVFAALGLFELERRLRRCIQIREAEELANKRKLAAAGA